MKIGAGIVLAIALAAIAGPALTPFDPAHRSFAEAG
jgi:hypothetical protein